MEVFRAFMFCMPRSTTFRCLLLLSFPGYSQVPSGFAEQTLLHETLTVWDYADVPIQWDMKGREQAFLNEGVNSLKEGGYGLAIDQLSKALELDPSISVARYYRSIAYKRSESGKAIEPGLYQYRVASVVQQAALEDIKWYVKENPKSYEGRLEWGKILMINWQAREAIKEFKRAIDLSPRDPRGCYYLGMALMESGDLSEATEQFEKCLNLDPTFTSGLMQIAFIEMNRKKDLKASISYVDRVLSIDSMERNARLIRFMIRTQEQKTKLALDDMSFLLTYEPTNWKLRISKAYLLIELESYDPAFSEIRRVLEATNISENFFVGKQTANDRRIDIQNAGYYVIRKVYGMDDQTASSIRKAFCLLAVGKYDKCLTTLIQMRNSESNPVATYLRAIALEHRDEYEAGLVYYEKTLALDDEVFDAHKKRAIMLTNLGKWKQAVEHFNAMVRLNPEFVPAYKLRGVAYYFLDDYRQSIRDFDHVIEKDTNDREVFYNRGMCYMNLKDTIPGLRDLIRAKEFKSIDFIALHAKVDRLMLKGDSLALHTYAELVMKVPSHQGWGADVEIMKVKLMHFERNWTFIHDRYLRLVYQKTGGDDVRYIASTITAEAVRQMEAGDYKSAAKLFDRALGYNKSNAMAYLERGALMLKMDQRDSAMQNFSQAAELGDQRAARMYETLGRSNR